MGDITRKLDAMKAAMEQHASAYLAACGTGHAVRSLESKTCLSYWFPKIADLVPVPRTEIVRTDVDLSILADGRTPDGWSGFLETLRSAVDRITGRIPHAPTPPFFLRTGHTSGKHGWSRTCYCDLQVCDLAHHVAAIVEYSMMADIMGLPTDVWAVRELLAVPSQFRCVRYGDMPVTPERRYFVDGSTLLYSIPYWPEAAIERGEPDDPHWRKKMALVQMEFPQEAAEMARRCGAACGGKWSVDVLLTGKGFVVTDMAEAERSWGWVPETCENIT